MLIFITWLTVAAWVYFKAERIDLRNGPASKTKNSGKRKYHFFPIPTKKPERSEDRIKIKKPLKINRLNG
jgi:hypothetical protein